MELAASTCAKHVKSRGEGRAPANGSAIRGMTGSEFEPRLFCCAEREKKETPSVRMVFSFWNAAGRVELAASTSAKRVNSGGEGRAPANGSAIRGMPVASRDSLRFLLLRHARRTNNKTCGQSQKETPSVRMVFSF